MRAACFQFDVSSASPTSNTKLALDAVQRAAQEGIDLLVLPEMWPTSFTSDVDDSVLRASEDAVAALAQATLDLPLVVCGSAYARGADRPTNRAHIVAGGRVVSGYDKVHLFSPTAEHLSFAAGDDPPPVVPTPVGRIATVICYDLRFPELVRATFRAGVELLVVCAQWPAARAAHWDALVRGRAVEGQFPVVACNRTGSAAIGRRKLVLEFPGNSLIVDSGGATLAAGAGRAGLVTAELDLESQAAVRRQIPVARDERPEVYARWTARGDQ
ncbi:MAG: hypothetical protein GY711_03605 [bacterium]|nr:hypothetical protein [bacterium]